MSEYLLTVKTSKHISHKEGLVKRTVGYVKAVEDVSFSAKQKQVYAIVGESGCGKALRQKHSAPYRAHRRSNI